MRKVCILIPILIFMSCASFGINLDTSEKKCLAARSELNILLKEYIDIQDGIGADIHKNAKALFKAASVTLDVWQANLGTDYDYTQDLSTWLNIKNEILEIINEYRNN